MREVSDITEPRHNMASGAILLEYGKSRALLMADAEEELWCEWLSGCPDSSLRTPVQFIKAAHHGSKNGYHASLFTQFGDPNNTVAVVTPFHQGRVHLPEDEGIRLLAPHARHVYCTSRSAASSSTSFTWDLVVPRPMPPFPSAWLQRLKVKPTLSQLLAPAANIRVVGGPTPSLPAEWVMDAHKKPELWHYIKPGLRQPVPGLVPAEDYTVSVGLDDAGTIVQLVGGSGTGILKR